MPACATCSGDQVDDQGVCTTCTSKPDPNGTCWRCNDELLANAKYCIECGAKVRKAVRPEDAANPAADEAKSAAPPKKQFQVKEAPKCNVCGKSVYKVEETQDSNGLVFHKDCFRCKTCKVYLSGRERVMEPESGISVKIANGMYLVAKEGSHLGNKGDFFCDKHSIKPRGEVVKAQDIDERYLDESELKRVASLRREQNDEARQSMQVRVGDAIPVCPKCGRPIDRGQKNLLSGLDRVHEVCPTQEESDKAIRPARWFVRKAPERLAGTFTCDKISKQPHTFLFELNKEVQTDCLKKGSYDKVTLHYNLDDQARTSANKKLIPPSSAATRAFDFASKDLPEFTFQNPKAKNSVDTPKLDKEKLTIRKYRFTNGVLQTLEITLKYDEKGKAVAAESLTLTLEMWPPELAAELAAQDPLADLKQNLS